MPIPFETLKVCDTIAAILRTDYEHNGELHLFRQPGATDVVGTLTDNWFGEVQSRFGINTQARGDTAFSNPRFYETLVSEESRFGMMHRTRDISGLELIDTENGYTYRLGSPSGDFLVFFLNRLGNLASKSAIRLATSSFRVRRAMEAKVDEQNAMDLVRRVYPQLLTCRVESRQNRTSDELASHANSFLFSLTYNLNAALVEMRSLDEFIRLGRLASMRRSRPTELEPPKRLYIRDLTYHYQLGVSAESPVLEFLSFYHVAEHFFESVFHDDLIEAIRERITRPDFSSKRKKDVQGLVREINKRQRIRDDTITFSELEALRLTLERHVPIENLRNKLSSYDKSIIEYLRSHPVLFSSGDVFDVESDDIRDTFEKMAKRIYKTRNSIVHSKDGDKSRFVPFKDDDTLSKEIPLIRFVAEEIIISSSSRL